VGTDKMRGERGENSNLKKRRKLLFEEKKAIIEATHNKHLHIEESTRQ